MNVLYEEDGGLKCGTVIERDGPSLTVESPHKKRSKLKADKVLCEFAAPAVGELLPQAQALADSVDALFLWECVGSDEFGFADVARDYFGHPPSPVEQAAVLLRLQGDAIHFHRRTRGHFQAATAAEVKSAEEVAARRAAKAQRLADWVDALGRGELPPELAARLPGLLYKPDPNTQEAKAVEQAAQRLRLPPVQLLARCGAVRSPHDYHLGRFLFEHFPRGTGFANVPPFERPAGLPRAAVAAFSIDDTTTTEVDDAFSVTRLSDGSYRVGIHIAAPALGFAPESAMAELGRERLSTVYMPGDKITMLPEPLIAAYSLNEGHDCPALSLYLTVAGDGSYRLLGSDTRVELVPIVANLRYPLLDVYCTDSALAADSGASFPFLDELRFLFGLSTALWTQRGKSDFDRPDFQFHIADDRVSISPRRRGAPSDRIVSELMIYVNSSWGKLLGDRDVRALFRVQDGGGKVRMSLYPAPHLSLGVSQYAWTSSPLRRYIDLVNQWLLLAVVYDEPSPYSERESELHSLLRDFELQSGAYDEFQRQMERYWSLRWLEQEGTSQVAAVVVKEGDTLIRFTSCPIWQRVPSVPNLPAGSVVNLTLSRIDLFDLTVHCEYRSEPPVGPG